ncbi:acyl-CoA dehydrogenase [Mesorhizobium sp. RMAD-H1]|uniref:acyl-CoA dehydrogenase n=1 Tax=Mesorhizobium sp. RMAD-H1 TaxID=2587065 RepID=UPI00161D95E6|nr:acyl-CoA dehydrogenase [Mesorhizobium sp. RMAD-H1]MBB2973249.1 alkylation response protein AidB-like acyl-CoA dehydrogenase [Mesorhizobium sp. RMAD-H1]
MLQTASPKPSPLHADRWSSVTRRLGFADLFEAFSSGAAQRDTARQPIFEEVAALKARGYGALRLPETEGGKAISLPELFALTRDLAFADPNIAHVYRNHFFVVEQHLQSPDAPLARRVLDLIAQGAMFGVAFSEAGGGPAGSRGQVPGARLQWSQSDGLYRISGRKIYSTGNMYADYLFSSAIDERSGDIVQFLVRTDTTGVVLDDDWDGFGQKLTGSGTTILNDVAISPADIFKVNEPRPDEPYLYGFTFHQIYLTTIISGIVTRVLHDALATIRGRTRNFYHGLADHPSGEPEIQSVIGRIAAFRSAIVAVVDRAVQALNAAWAGAKGSEAEGLSIAASIAAAEAKVVTDEVAANLASLLIDIGSGSAVSTAKALDRHWRNIKVIASHNPRIYKERVIGDHYLNGSLPPTGAFF